MAERVLLQPPDIIEVKTPLIFLAGPIQGAPDWQSKATDIIHSQVPEIAIASPRKEYPEGTFVYEDQVDWETHYLSRAANFGATMFWLARQTEETPGRAYAQTSRFELGECKMRHERDGAILVVGIEDGFGNSRYIRRRLNQDCPDVPILDSLQATCVETVERVANA